MMKLSTLRHSMFVDQEISSENWKDYPKEVLEGLETDPGESEELDKEMWSEVIQKWKRTHGKTKKSAGK